MADFPRSRLVQSPYQHLKHTLSDPEEFAAAVSGADLQAEFFRAPDGSTFVEQFQSMEWALDFYDAKVKARIIGTSPPGWGSIALMRNEAPSRWYGMPSQRGLLVFTPPGEAIDGCIVPGFQGVSIHVSPEIWERCRRLASNDPEEVPSRGNRLGTVRVLPPRSFDEIDSRLLSLRDLLSNANQSGSSVVASSTANQLFTELLTLAWEHQEMAEIHPRREQQSPRNRARLARQAEDWLRAHLHESISISDLCLAFRVSRREMEYAFRQAFDLSPHDRLRVLRLNAVYNALRRTSPDRGEVTRIAMEHGITHLGRFAAQYRNLFGELPRYSLVNQNPIPKRPGDEP